jgi:hypothetical protein
LLAQKPSQGIALESGEEDGHGGEQAPGKGHQNGCNFGSTGMGNQKLPCALIKNSMDRPPSSRGGGAAAVELAADEELLAACWA